MREGGKEEAGLQLWWQEAKVCLLVGVVGYCFVEEGKLERG